ncbi:unnamed protein product [Rotaria sp. Silwood2]|nr:unnamed protein product [Rotaria sp. Silwood2]CAF2865893.1 unnamed protein product [Rotaria sp. Silwood2]CAF3203271.1 unnamed protein product [Rotaria sp. Silwood2]CAF3333286.1 unnamed protein product [Rotaria sp. Silwood2]CAF4580636.1 unnamed protein product [Rotaria sp. Silwood2]
MGLFGNKREKCEKVDKYEYHSSSKGARPGYGPPALIAAPPSPYFSSGAPYFDGYGQVAPQGKMSKYGKYGGPSKSLYGGDPMQQAMLLPPQSSAAMQAQAAAMLQMQQYMQGQNGGGLQFAGILPPIQMPLSTAQQVGLLPGQGQQFYGFAGQQGATPYFDPNNVAFQQQGAFAPYQQPNFYDPATAAAFAGPYGYMPAAF